MNLELTEDQQMMRESFARFLTDHSSPSRVRAAMPSGFDRTLWQGLAALGAFGLRVPEEAGGLGLGLLDAVVVMEEVGRTLALGPIAEALVAHRLLARLGSDRYRNWLEGALSGAAVITIAFHDIAVEPCQWVAGGAIADAVIALEGDSVMLIELSAAHRNNGEPNLASTSLAELDFNRFERRVLAKGVDAQHCFSRAIEEWKLLVAAALMGLSREAIRLAAAYACERHAFGQPIGTYQAISHPLADRITEVDGGKYFTWSTIRAIGDGDASAGARISLAAWWSAQTATRSVAQALHTFGGYGLTTEYDIHLFNLRAKDWPLIFGDPARFLEEAGRRLYAGEEVLLPDVGPVSIDFDLGEDARTLASELDAFFVKTLTPELKAKAHYSWDGHDPEVHRQLAQARLLFPSWPREWGGRDAAAYAMSALSHVWEQHDWSGHAMGTTNMVGTIIRRFGSQPLKREVLSRIAAGEVVCSLGYTEPSCGSDVFAAATKATRDGEGWRIDGQKMFTSGANIASHVLMLTRTNPSVPKHKGLTMFIVPLDAPGVTIQPVHTFQDERTNITYYDGVKVPDSYRLGEVDGGVKVMAGALELEHGGGFEKSQRRLLHAAESVCRDIRYRGRPLIEDPAAQARLARTAAHYFVAEIITQRALWAGVNELPNRGYGPMAKLFSTEKFLSDAADLLDLTAPHSLSKREGPAGFINLSYRHAQATTIYGGTSEVHRSMIAERNLGLPRTRA